MGRKSNAAGVYNASGITLADQDEADFQFSATGELLVATSSSGSEAVVGNVASGATDSGAPIKIGGRAATSLPTAVTNGQRVNAQFSTTGKLVAVGSLREQMGVQQTTITSSTAETTIVTAVASTFTDLYALVITNTSATITKVTIKDATAGTTRLVLEVPATDTRGFTLSVDSAITQAVVNNNWTATCGTSVASVEITALFVKNV